MANNDNKAYDNKAYHNEGDAHESAEKGKDTRSRGHRHHCRHLLVDPRLRHGRHCLVHPSFNTHETHSRSRMIDPGTRYVKSQWAITPRTAPPGYNGLTFCLRSAAR